MLTTREQLGQRPFLPAAPGGVRTRLWQYGHENSIRCGSPLDGGVALAERWLRGPAGTLGIGTIAPQLGHFPFFPAVVLGVRTGRPHSGQANSILSASISAPDSGVAAASGACLRPAPAAADAAAADRPTPDCDEARPARK